MPSAIPFRGKGILLDIEGTTSSIRFVYDVLFPYARRELHSFLATRWDQPDVTAARELIARDAGFLTFADWQATQAGSSEPPLAGLCREVLRLMEADAKVTGLKALQGLIWREGFARGELRAHVYPDVPPALASWNEAGLDVRIYSSGSVTAQREFFAHTDAGDLSRYLKGHYDTTIGSKRDPDSYTRIAAHIGVAPQEILFVSDVSSELEAAGAAGMTTALAIRDGNPDPGTLSSSPIVTDLRQIVSPDYARSA